MIDLFKVFVLGVSPYPYNEEKVPVGIERQNYDY